MTPREIITKFGFQVEHDKLDKVEKQLEAIKQRIGFLAGVELAKGLLELGEKFATFAEQLHVAAASAGLTVESFQQLSFSAKQSSVSTEEMEHSMVRLARALYSAKVGGAEAQKAFYLAGITQQQITSFRTSKDALLALADRFRDMKDPIEKQALAQQLLGRGSLHMVGYLSQGSEAIRQQGEQAQKLGLIISEKQVNALVKLEHALQKVFAWFQSFGAAVAAHFAPVIEFVIDRFLKLVSANRGLLELNVENFFENVAYGVGYVIGIIEGLIAVIIRLAKQFHIEGDILPAFAKIAGAVTGLLAVGAAFRVIGSAVSLMASPIIVVSTAIAGIVTSVHDLYILLFKGGGLKDTWLYQAADKFGFGKALTGASDYISDKGAEALNYFNGQDSNITNNVTVNATTGASPKEIGKEVADAIANHTASMLRGAQAGTAAGIIR